MDSVATALLATRSLSTTDCARLAARARQKSLGAYYTPDHVVRSLVRWAVVRPDDTLLDPACGDGRFLAAHPRSTGVDHDAAALALACQRAPGRRVVAAEFFDWASRTPERFDAAAGNPPVIRYQRFSGAKRECALAACARHGARR